MTDRHLDDADWATAAEQSSEDDEAQEGSILADQERSVEPAEHAALHVVDEDAEPAAELRAGVGEQPFVYRVQRCAAALPSYGGRVPRGGDRYYRLEVHLRDGGQGYDVMGYTRAQLIDDVLDQYERHLEFLRLADA